MPTRICLLHNRSILGGLLLTLLVLLASPGVTRADAPFTRGPASAPQGGVTVRSSTWATWANIQPLPVSDRMRAGAWADTTLPAPTLRLPLQQLGQSGESWLERKLNPGNWILDAGLGIIGGTLRLGIIVLTIAWSALTGSEAGTLNVSCTAGATDFVFCTPTDRLFNPASAAGGALHTIWGLLNPVATAIVTLLFVVWCGRLALEGPQSLATEGKALALRFLITLSCISGSPWIFAQVLGMLNALHSALLSSMAPISLPEVPGLQVADLLALGVFWLLLITLVLKAFSRLIKLVILLSIAPVMAALLIDRSTAPRFHAWLGKVVDTLVQQTTWVVFFFIGGTLFGQGTSGVTGDAAQRILSIVLGCMTVLTALSGESVLAGIAGAGASGGFATRLVSSVVGAGVLRRMVRGGLKGAASSTKRGVGVRGAAHSRSGTPPERRSASGATGHTPPTTSADPTRSATAQRRGGVQRRAAPSSITSPARGGTTAREPRTDAPGTVARRHQPGAPALPPRPRTPSAHGRPSEQSRLAADRGRAGAMRERAPHQSHVLGGQKRRAHTPNERTLAQRLHTHRLAAKAQRHDQAAGRTHGAQAHDSNPPRRIASSQARDETQAHHAEERVSAQQQLLADTVRRDAIPQELAAVGATALRRERFYALRNRPARVALAQRVAQQRMDRLDAEQRVLSERRAARQAQVQGSLSTPGAVLPQTTRSLAAARVRPRSATLPRPALHAGQPTGALVQRPLRLPPARPAASPPRSLVQHRSHVQRAHRRGRTGGTGDTQVAPAQGRRSPRSAVAPTPVRPPGAARTRRQAAAPAPQRRTVPAPNQQRKSREQTPERTLRTGTTTAPHVTVSADDRRIIPVWTPEQRALRREAYATAWEEVQQRHANGVPADQRALRREAATLARQRLGSALAHPQRRRTTTTTEES